MNKTVYEVKLVVHTTARQIYSGVNPFTCPESFLKDDRDRLRYILSRLAVIYSDIVGVEVKEIVERPL